MLSIYLSSGENRYTSLPFGIRHLDLQVARKEAQRCGLLLSHRARREMDRTLFFIFSFVAVYLGALNPEAKRSAFGSCREEMKGFNSTAILWSSFLLKLCMIHGLHQNPSSRRPRIINAQVHRICDFFLLLLQITLSTLHTASFTCGCQHSPFTSANSLSNMSCQTHLLYKKTTSCTKKLFHFRKMCTDESTQCPGRVTQSSLTYTLEQASMSPLQYCQLPWVERMPCWLPFSSGQTKGCFVLNLKIISDFK